MFRTATVSKVHTSVISSVIQPKRNAAQHELLDPIKTYQNNAVDVLLDDISLTTNFAKVGNREICYCGDVPFGFGRNKLKTNPYPSEIPDFLIKIKECICSQDINFSFQSYSCMIERYIDGSSSFPHHTDPENSIESNSYTIYLSELRVKLNLST